jgi:hypothetical protein
MMDLIKCRALRIVALVLLTSALESPATAATLRFEIVDAITLAHLPARFSIQIDGVSLQPERVNRHAMRFVSVHEAKKQTFVACYSLGTGVMEVSIPDGTETLELAVARGFQYLPVKMSIRPGTGDEITRIRLNRWIDLKSTGWMAGDAHLHYDRLGPKADRIWFAMMAGDGLDSAHFMFLKGGKVPGEWAIQFDYGKAGESIRDGRLITAGMEYRDSAQGHINLLGMPETVQPIMAGTRGLPNYPTLDSVLRRTRAQEGVPIVAHGGSLGRSPTVILDAILGAPDAIEIGNSHLFSLANWYALANGGFVFPPAAGTDLPNYPERDWWQPFLGGMRMFVKTDGASGFDAWKRGLLAGRVFVSSGPLLTLFTVNGRPMGQSVDLAGPGKIRVEAEVATPIGIGMEKFELIQNGNAVPVRLRKSSDEALGIVRWQLTQTLDLTESCWLAVRAEGPRIRALHRAVLTPTSWHKREAVMHSAVIPVRVRDKPLKNRESTMVLWNQIRNQRAYYAERGTYENAVQKQEMLDLFDRAIVVLSEAGEQ